MNTWEEFERLAPGCSGEWDLMWHEADQDPPEVEFILTGGRPVLMSRHDTRWWIFTGGKWDMGWIKTIGEKIRLLCS